MEILYTIVNWAIIATAILCPILLMINFFKYMQSTRALDKMFEETHSKFDKIDQELMDAKLKYLFSLRHHTAEIDAQSRKIIKEERNHGK